MAKVAFDANNGTFSIVEMPALTGTPKQVAWAQDIRKDMCARDVTERLNNLMRKALHEGKADLAHQQAPGAAARLTAIVGALLDARTEARWWIDNRLSDLQMAGHAFNRAKQEA